MAEIQMQKLRDHHKALTIQLDAIEAAEYKWKNKNFLASQYNAEYKRLVAVVNRYEGNYNSLYSRLHEMRVSEELKAARIVPEDIRKGRLYKALSSQDQIDILCIVVGSLFRFLWLLWQQA